MRALATGLLLATLLPLDSDAQEFPATSPAEVPVSAVESIVAPFAQHSAAIASDGESYFVVWEDHRRGGAWSDVYGSRVSAEGEVLDPLGIPIATTSGQESAPTVAWTGSNYLVVWHWSDSPPNGSVVAKRVSRDGIVLDASPHLIWFGMSY